MAVANGGGTVLELRHMMSISVIEIVVLYLQMYSLEEMEMIANLCKKHDAVCIADEVYEWLVYSNSQKHRKIGEYCFVGRKACRFPLVVFFFAFAFSRQSIPLDGCTPLSFAYLRCLHTVGPVG
jgi:hypothetical protein